MSWEAYHQYTSVASPLTLRPASTSLVCAPARGGRWLTHRYLQNLNSPGSSYNHHLLQEILMLVTTKNNWCKTSTETRGNVCIYLWSTLWFLRNSEKFDRFYESEKHHRGMLKLKCQPISQTKCPKVQHVSALLDNYCNRKQKKTVS